ncbi:MAG: excinuclease ABC subunit UvrC [Kofleriaceae bacterium]
MLTADVLDRVPTDPGVYLFKDARGAVVYVGKAKNLRARVRQYFRPGGDERFFVAAGLLGRAAADVETIVVADEKAALLLENHLIKRHQPRFNVKLRDDKQYLVLRVRPPSDDPAASPARRFPRVEVVRNIADDDARYFGPYHSATGARQTLRVLNRHFQLRTCTDHVLEHRGRPCLQYQIKRCPGPCAFELAPGAYAEQVDDVMMFLAGKDRELLSRLRARMATRAEAEDFEVAAALRDSIRAVERTLTRQDVVQDDLVDQDVWGLHREADRVWVVVLFVRGGKLVGRRVFTQREQELASAEVVAEHVQRYYDSGTLVPDEVVVGVDLGDGPDDATAAEVLADWLTELRGARRRKVRVIEPRRGTRARLVELAARNAAAAASSRQERDADAAELLTRLAERLGLRRPPRRIECFDIAHTQGRETVASMVTFIDGVPAKARYRKFKVATAGNDDFASMYEVLSRRLRRARSAVPRDGDGDDDASADPWALPDLLVVDGGKGQLGMALAAIADAGLEVGGERGLDVVGLAKERDLAAGEAPDRIYRPGVKDAIALRPNTVELYLLARLRDEAHRFANTFHRQRRGKAALTSELDGVPGIGARRRTALLRHFGSVRAIRAATVDELARAPGMTRVAAEGLARHLAAAASTEEPAEAPVADQIPK